MDFSQILLEIKDGKKARREVWRGTGMFIFLVYGSTFQVNRPPLLGIYPEGTTIDYLPHIDVRTPSGTIGTWTINQIDILATDWEIMENINE